MTTWADAESFLISSAVGDLADGNPIVPVLLAFCGEKPLFFAGLRDFEKGEYHGPMIELLALAGALGANRLACGFPGRAWSLDDPLPPVIEGVGDLRQRVLALTFVDATVRPTLCTSTVAPYELDGGGGRWQTPLRDEAAKGWVTEAMVVCAEQHDALRDDAGQAREQALRCVDLGHLLGLHPRTAQRLKLEVVPGLG